MQCPMCFGATTVKNSRPEIDCIRRTRMCLDCRYVFKTIEVDEDMHKNLKVDKEKRNDR